MSADPPSYEPYKVFDYSANFDADDDGLDEWVEFTDNTMVSMGDAALSCPAIHARIERIQGSDCLAIMVLHHDVEHRNVVNLLKLCEDAQCPDCVLQKVMEWANTGAKLEGFNFNPQATTQKANIQWMYKALEHSHGVLQKVLQLNLEDQDKASLSSLTEGQQLKACPSRAAIANASDSKSLNSHGCKEASPPVLSELLFFISI
jgi:hypothetical protein